MSERAHGDPVGAEPSTRRDGQLRERDLVELLSRLDPEPLERTALRLQQADLLTLARFPSQPHELIHEAVSCLHTVLLSLSVTHEAADLLQHAPWPLLRLDLLANIDSIWRKMWKRLVKLRHPQSDPRRKPLANAQIRFVLQHVLVPVATTPPKRSTILSSETVVSVFARVSSIAEAVIAYVLLCAHYSIVPPALSVPSPSKSLVLSSLSASPSKQHQLKQLKPSRQDDPVVVANVHTSSRSWRCGMKNHGRFFLFHAVVPQSSLSNATESSSTGAMSVLSLDRHHAAYQWEEVVHNKQRERQNPSHQETRPKDSLDVQYARLWTKRVVIPTSLATLLARAPLPLGILVQAASQTELFTPPVLGLRSDPSLRREPASRWQFSLHVVEVALPRSRKHEGRLKLQSIGQVSLFDPATSLADLRVHLLACGSPAVETQASPSSQGFHFFHAGLLVPFNEEPWRRALDLVPVAIVCRSRNSPTEKLSVSWISDLSNLHRSLVPTLCRYLQPPSQHPSVSPLPPRIHASLYPVDQPLSPDTISGLLTTFLEWSAFVQFQQLQDTTTMLYEGGSPHKPMQPQPKEALVVLETEQRLRPDPTPQELEVLSLPRTPFDPEKEYLEPLYASLAVKSRTKGVLTSPFLYDVAHALASASEATSIRIVVENDECVLHVTTARLRHTDTTKSRRKRLVIRFVRDASCPLEILLTMRDAYVWLIKPIAPQLQSGVKHRRSKLVQPPAPQLPPRWLRDVLRFVVHPTLDFSVLASASSLSYWPYPSRFHRVRVPHAAIETSVEATFWSRTIDWRDHWRTCDVETELLRPLFDKLCHSFPFSFAIDGVKFSKFLRECGLQPAVLSVGDAAFLFTTHRAPGSHYEMIYEGFAAALCWIATRIYSHCHDHDHDATELLHTLCFDWLLRAPSLEETWRRLVHSWRLQEKLKYMETAAIQYCASTRIQANWKRLVVRRMVIDELTRLKNERRAAAKIQSVFKMRKQWKTFVQLKRCVVRTQLFLKARRQLRQLRAERAALVERMRGRLQKWMRQRLRVLRCWKQINADWLARRARILEKRSRLVCAGAYLVESRLYRMSLYRSPPVALDGSASSNEATSYELEILEPRMSQWRSMVVEKETLDLLEQQAQGALGMTKPAHAQDRKRWKLLVLVQRLHFKRPRDVRASEPLIAHEPKVSLLQLYRDPIDTSLGRLIFQGPVRDYVNPNTTRVTSDRLFLRLLLRSHDLTLLTYSSRSCIKQRLTFTTLFVYSVFQVTHWLGLTLTEETAETAKTRVVMAEHAFVVTALTKRADKLQALRVLLQYIVCYGTKPPTRELLPEEVAKREAERREREEQTRQAAAYRERTLVILAQTNGRRFLAIRHVQRLAQASYIKCFDCELMQVVYRHWRQWEEVQYTSKPHSLRDRDVREPIDEWIPASEKGFFNPLRGVYSRLNETQAVILLQRWYRRVMWACGLPAYDLRTLTQSLLFHHNVRTPTSLSDPRELNAITHFALQRHLIHHDYKTALGLYEAALKHDTNHVPALIGLAVLLIFSCRYPAKQTWTRGLELLETARKVLNGDLKTAIPEIESSCFRWAVFLDPKSPNALGNFAVFLQCVRGDLDRAELLYRRAIDVDPSNEWIIENYLRLQRERTPEGLYKASGPSKVSIWRAREVRRLENSDWREMEDTSVRFPSAERFFQNSRTGSCVWTVNESLEG